MSYSTVFLDRDGVINQDSPDYIKGWDEFHFIPGSLDAIARLNGHGIQVIVITNQSVINRGMVAPQDLAAMHAALCRTVGDSGGCITDIFYCPHRPDEDCSCRKPRPGLILSARDRHGIDLQTAVMVGDSATDILAGKAAGCARTVLVQTGNGVSAAAALADKGVQPDHIAAELDRAVDWILAGCSPSP